ncbi:MAG: hypothetical protein ISR65_01875 [Bacteriovoracaceae bacterium]|nr:hypothetical protein [Bacteriovoracaceae bacterium]
MNSIELDGNLDDIQEIFKVVEDEEVDQVIHQLIKEKGEFSIWKSGDEFSEIFIPVSFEDDILCLKRFEEEESHLVDKNIMLKFEKARSQFFTSGTLTYDDEEDLFSIDLEYEIFKMDKRQDARLCLSMFEGVVTFENESYEAFDVSKSGISFISNSSEDFKYPEGQIIKDVELSFNEQTFAIKEAQLLHIFRVENVKKQKERLKIGMKFVDPSQELIERLEMEITNCSLYILSRSHK